MTDTELQPHILVAGHGRSGTNMVLDLYDCHPDSFCRNEPNELVGTAFMGLGDGMFSADIPADFEDRWREAMTRTFRSSGARDRFGTQKNYFRNSPLAQAGQWLAARGRLRALVLPRQNGLTVEQWSPPSIYYDRTRQAHALPILKLLLTPAWVIAAHDLIPAQRVVHVVRRPQDFIQSWWARYVQGIGGGPQKVFAANQPSLARILAYYGQANINPQPYSQRALIVSELWRWRYINEMMIDRLDGTPRYLRVYYDSVMANRTGGANQLYDFARLEITPASSAAISDMENTLFRARKADNLSATLVDDAVAEVLADSPHRDRLLGQSDRRE